MFSVKTLAFESCFLHVFYVLLKLRAAQEIGGVFRVFPYLRLLVAQESVGSQCLAHVVIAIFNSP